MKTYKQRGYSMVELMIVLTIAGIAAWGINRWRLHEERIEQLSLAAAHMQKIITATNSFIGGNFDILSDLSSVDQVQAATASTNPSKNPIFQRAVPRITGFQHHYEDSYRQRYIAWRNAGSSSASLPDPTDTSTYDDTSEYNTCPDHLCTTITVQDLKNWGYLDQSESLTNNLGQGYRIVVRKIVLSPQQNNIDALLFTDTPVVNNSNSNLGAQNDVGDAWRMAKKIQGNYMAVTAAAHPSDVAGIPASTALDNVFADGEIVAFGQNAKKGEFGWFAKGKKWGTNNAGGDGWWTEALLVARVGYWSDNPNGVYLRRDGSLPATGPLNMGGNSIINVDKVGFQPGLTVKMGDTCDGKDENGIALAAPNNKDFDHSVAMTGDGQLATCRSLTAYTPAGIQQNRKRWAKPGPSYSVADDVTKGAMDGAMSAPMYLYTQWVTPGNPQWKTLRVLLKKLPAGTSIYIPNGDYNQPGGYSTVVNTSEEYAVVFLDENQPMGNNMVAGPYRIADSDGSPVRWVTTSSVSIPATANTTATVGLDGAPGNYKNWVYEEWLFSASDITKNTYASVPLTLNAGDHTMIPGSASLQAGSATVAVPKCTTDALGVETCTSMTVPVQGGTVQGGNVQGKVYTPYAYPTRFSWSANYFGKICSPSGAACFN